MVGVVASCIHGILAEICIRSTARVCCNFTDVYCCIINERSN